MISDGARARPEPRSLARRLRRAVPRAVAVTIVAVVFGIALPRIASYRDVIDVVAGLSALHVAVLAAVTVWNTVTFAPPWMAAVPRLGFLRALVLSQASTAAASVFPGGEAVGMGVSLGMLRGWGFGRRAVIAATAVLGAFNTLAKVVLPAAAVVALVATGGEGGLLGILTGVGLAVVALLLAAFAMALRTQAATQRLGDRLDPLLNRLRRLLRREPGEPVGERLVHFRHETLSLLRRRWLSLTVATLVGHLAVFLVLLAAARAVGVSAGEVSTLGLFAAWTLIRLLSAIPVTPGGLGVVELGLTGALVAGGADNAEAVAAVLLYRALTWLPPLALGLPSALLWRRLQRPPAST
jgi:uncharacterized protein (TIRG00374 family)